MPDDAGPAELPTVVFHFVKSNFFRVVHADGVHGGLTPHSLIEMNFFSERHPIPKSVVHPLEKSGSLGEEIREKRVTRDGPVREVDVGVMMNLTSAISFRDWLDDKIKRLQAREAKK
jgi:hypothetical protein